MSNLEVKLDMTDANGGTSSDRTEMDSEVLPKIGESLMWNAKQYGVWKRVWTPQASAQQVILKLAVEA